MAVVACAREGCCETGTGGDCAGREGAAESDGPVAAGGDVVCATGDELAVYLVSGDDDGLVYCAGYPCPIPAGVKLLDMV